jgi:hypothetical protein
LLKTTLEMMTAPLLWFVALLFSAFAVHGPRTADYEVAGQELGVAACPFNAPCDGVEAIAGAARSCPLPGSAAWLGDTVATGDASGELREAMSEDSGGTPGRSCADPTGLATTTFGGGEGGAFGATAPASTR